MEWVTSFSVEPVVIFTEIRILTKTALNVTADRPLD